MPFPRAALDAHAGLLRVGLRSTRFLAMVFMGAMMVHFATTHAQATPVPTPPSLSPSSSPSVVLSTQARSLRNPTNPPTSTPFDPEIKGNSAEIRAFINRVSAEQGIDASILRAFLNQAQWSQTALNLTQPLVPADSVGGGRQRDWTAYRARFVNQQRLLSAQSFNAQNSEDLARAEKIYSVPSTIISSILNVESRYGGQTGKYKVVDVLATLAFYHTTRRAFFQQELAEIVRLWRSGLVDIDTTYGSFAGAIGMAQFMPTNVRLFATDFDGDGHIDLNTMSDAIGSVAQYLARHGWRAHDDWQAMLVPINVEGINEEWIRQSLADGPKPTISRIALAKVLATQKDEVKKVNGERLANITEPITLVDLPSPNGTTYRLASMNYYVLTRYNRSFDYATAVFDLAMAMECVNRGGNIALCLLE